MIITCTECQSKFLVNAEQLGEAGRKVRCGNCGHVWMQAPLPPEQLEEQREVKRAQEENIREAVRGQAAGIKPSLPTVVEPPNVKWLRVAIFLLVAGNVLAFIAFNKSLIGQTGFYDMISQYQTNGVKISQAELLPPKQEKGRIMQYVSWAVKNESGAKRQLPMRRIKLLDKNLEVVGEGKDDQVLTLKEGQELKFEPNSIPNPGNKGKYLVLEIGNPHELATR